MEIVDYLLARKKAGGGSDVTVEQLSVTENGTYSEQGIAYSPVVVNVPTPENSYQLTDIPTGAVSTIEDGTDLPMSSLKVDIEPAQDLHGYDHPWAGGAGKNKYPDTQDINLGGTNPRTVTNAISVPIGAGTYVISWKSTGDTTPNLQMRIDGVNTSLYSGNSFTVTSSANQCYWFITMADYDANKTAHIYDIQIESGSTATTYAPYSNICPISGWTAANIIVSPTTSAEDGTTCTIEFKDGTNPLTVYGGTLNVTSGELVVDRVKKQLSTNDNIAKLGNTTVYMDGWSDVIKPTNPKLGLLYCSHYKEELQSLATDGCVAKPVNNRAIVFYDNVHAISVNDFKAYIAEQINNGTPIEIVYKLETPTTYHLTPTQVRTLVGNNNIWADTGDVLSGKYFKEL